MSKPVQYTQKYIANKHQFITVGSNDTMLIPSIVSQPNVTAMTIIPGGNVGIGTTNPLVKLDVNGSIKGVITSGTVVTTNSTSHTVYVPSWAKRITIMFRGVTYASSAVPLIQLGTVSGTTTTGYVSIAGYTNTAPSSGASYVTSGLHIQGGGGGNAMNGMFLLTLQNSSTNTWVSSNNITFGVTSSLYGSGGVDLANPLTYFVLTTTAGNISYNAGSINVLYEG